MTLEIAFFVIGRLRQRFRATDDRGVRSAQQFCALRQRQFRDRNRMSQAQFVDFHGELIGELTRRAANLDLVQRVFQDAAFFCAGASAEFLAAVSARVCAAFSASCV